MEMDNDPGGYGTLMIINGGVGGAGGLGTGTGTGTGTGGAGGAGGGPEIIVEAAENLSVDVRGDLNLSTRYEAHYQLSGPTRSFHHSTANNICLRPALPHGSFNPEYSGISSSTMQAMLSPPRPDIPRSLMHSSVPLFDSAANVRINEGNGDFNFHFNQPAMRQARDFLNTHEFTFSEGTSLQSWGVQRDGQPDCPPLPFPRLKYELGAPAVLEPVEMAGPDTYDAYAHSPQRLSAAYHDMLRGSAASGHRLGDSASMASPSHTLPVYDQPPSSSAPALRQPVPTVPEPPLISSHPHGIRLIAPTPRTPPINPNELALYNYLPTNFGAGRPSQASHRFPVDFRGGHSLAPLVDSPLWGSSSNRPQTNINVSGNMNNIQRQGESGFHTLGRAVPTDGFYNAAARYQPPRCHPDTRTAMLEDLHEWSSRTDFGSSILWLHGPAGAGKSAIAQSFCEMLKAEARLGASFFFKRGDASRGSGSRLFSAIAYQLARSLPDLKQAISAIVEDDPSIVDTDLSTQVLKLIIEPCRFNTPTCNLVVVVIDGLDECEGHHIQREILRLLGTVVCTQPLPFRILVASRPEPHIQEVFHNALNEIHRPLNINQSFEDVQTYLVDEFRRIHREHWETMALVGEPWPPSNVIEKLADKSSGYFVYPSLVVRFIDDRDFRPTERLDVIMGLRETKTEAPFAALDQLYIEILSTVPASSHQRLIEILAVLAAKFNLSIFHIEQLLDMETGDARLILRRLQSVLDVPQNIGERLKVHHASFLDFLEDPTRSGLFYIGDSQRMNLARHILKALSFAVSGENSHVAWQFDQVEFEYVMSIQPTPALVSDLCSLNHNFLIFPSVHHVIRRVLSWLRRCQPLPHSLIHLWEDYQAVVTSGVCSPSRLESGSEGIPEELESGRHFPQASAKLARMSTGFMSINIKRLLGYEDLNPCDAVDADAEGKNLAEKDSFTDLVLYYGYSWQGASARRLFFNQGAVDAYCRLAETDPTVFRAVAWSLYNLGLYLSMAGQYEAAARADKEAVELYRKLTETDPSVTDKFACCLHNLAVHLSHVGQYEAAVCATEEAVHLRRKLAETNSFIITELASSLHNLGFQLNQSGQYEAAARAAEEAVHLRRKLAETDPTVTKDLTWSLHNFAIDLHNTGQYEAAVRADKESVELCRKLTETDPFVTDRFACCLHHLGFALSQTGQYEAAVCATEEAVHLRRKLAETNSFIITELASSLHNLGFQLSQSGQYEAAARAAEEAVHLRRELAETDPTVTKDLAWSLHNFAIDLHNTGQYEAAVRADKEAVEICRKLTEIAPFGADDLAWLLHSLGFHLSQVGQYEAAVCATEEALHLRRKLAETNSFIITELASSLHNLGFQLGQTGQYEAAACAEEEAVHLRRELAETDPSITKDLAWSLYNLGLDLRRIGRHQDALPTDAEAVEIFRQRADSEADQAVKDDLVYLLESYALNLKAVGRHKEAASTIQEAFENHSRPLHTVESELHLANILTTWAIYLRAVERQEDSIQIHERGAEIYGRLSETDPESTADFLCDLAADFSTTGLHEDAVCAAEKAVELYRTLTPTKPVFMEDLIETLGYLAKSLRALGCEEDAACAEAEAVTLKGAQCQSEESAIQVAKPDAVGGVSEYLAYLVENAAFQSLRSRRYYADMRLSREAEVMTLKGVQESRSEELAIEVAETSAILTVESSSQVQNADPIGLFVLKAGEEGADDEAVGDETKSLGLGVD